MKGNAHSISAVTL